MEDELTSSLPSVEELRNSDEFYKRLEAKLDFMVFLDYVRIQDTDANSNSAEMAFVKWPHLMELAEALINERFIHLLKARQLGATWCVVAYCYWLAAYHPGIGILIISKGELEAKEFISRMGFIRDRLPKDMQTSQVGDNKQEWEFSGDGLESKVLALSSSTDAGRSFAATVIVHDEADFHPELESSYGATGPIIDNGGRHISLSSPNPDNGPESFFKQRSIAAKDGVSGYKFLFFDCWVRPDHTAEWYETVSKRYSSDRMHKEHPRDLQEALESPGTLQGISHQSLDVLKERCRVPFAFQDGQPSDARIFTKFYPGHSYAAFTDTSHGTGGDFSVTVVLDCDAEAIVADIFSQHLEPHELAWQSVRLLQMYDNPLWGIEDNEWGRRTIDKAEELKYRRIYHRPVSANDYSDGRIGWTTDRRTRPLLISELKESCLAGHLTVYAEDGLGQFYDLAKKPEKDGRIEALDGRHDDYPIAVGGALMMKKWGRLRPSRATESIPDGNGGYDTHPIYYRTSRKLPSAHTGSRW